MSTTSRPSKPSTAPSAPTPPLHPSTTSTVDASAQLIGSNPLYLGPLTTLHPRARIVTTYATVRIGEGSVICERAVLGREKARGGEGAGQGNGQSEEDGTDEEVVIGDYVLVEPGAVVEAASIGEGSTIGVGCVLGDGCIIGEVPNPPHTSPLCTIKDPYPDDQPECNALAASHHSAECVSAGLYDSLPHRRSAAPTDRPRSAAERHCGGEEEVAEEAGGSAQDVDKGPVSWRRA
ncbi:MAG: hypothetical protein M1824_000117 [Vezdaea acicularis]|nr:MAG: hypothetical protein M1824_000117 [Vezdaea acicularis]